MRCLRAYVTAKTTDIKLDMTTHDMMCCGTIIHSISYAEYWDSVLEFEFCVNCTQKFAFKFIFSLNPTHEKIIVSHVFGKKDVKFFPGIHNVTGILSDSKTIGKISSCLPDGVMRYSL